MTKTPAPSDSRYFGAKPSQSRSPVSANTSAPSSNEVFRRNARNRAIAGQMFMVPTILQARAGAMNPGVAASRQSAAIRGNNSQRRSAETPLRGGGSWEAPFVFRMHWDHEPPPHPPFGHPLPLRGREGWGEGAVHGKAGWRKIPRAWPIWPRD